MFWGRYYNIDPKTEQKYGTMVCMRTLKMCHTTFNIVPLAKYDYASGGSAGKSYISCMEEQKNYIPTKNFWAKSWSEYLVNKQGAPKKSTSLKI